MIKQYLDYKRKKIDELLESTNITEEEKRRELEEYNKFLGCCFRENSNGRFVLDNGIAHEVMQLVRENKLPLIIDQYDTNILLDIDMPNARGGNPFNNIDDIVAVHKSKIPPKNDTIITPENNGVTSKLMFTDPTTGLEHEIFYLIGNDTIHFTLNCAVLNHEVGNDWDSYKYAVMIDFGKLDKEKILDVKSEDTYIDGDAYLGDNYFLFCPLGEREKVQDDNPSSIVIEYDGISLNQAISSMIIYSGRKLEPFGAFGWGREFEFSAFSQDNKYLDELLEKEGYPNLRGQFGSLMHSESKYMSRRMWKREYEAIIALIEYNKSLNIEMPDYAMSMILEIGGAYGLPGSVPVSIDTYKEYVVPILEKHGYQVTDELFEGIDSGASGMKYISHYPDPRFNGMMMPSVVCPEWEFELRKRVVNLVSGKEINYTDGDDSKSSGK